jgi:hypothetical protein
MKRYSIDNKSKEKKSISISPILTYYHYNNYNKSRNIKKRIISNDTNNDNDSDYEYY